MNALTTHTFDTHKIRVVQIDGDPWFVAADVCAALEIASVFYAYSRLSADEKGKVGRTHLGMRPGKDAVIVSESGLYKLIMRSDKPEARRFQDWVTRDVLPTIRKTGSYVMGEEHFDLSTEEGLLMASQNLVGALSAKLETYRKENAKLRDELLYCTIREFADHHLHRYLDQGISSLFGRRASKVAQTRGIEVRRENKKLIVKGGRVVESPVRAFPVDLLMEIWTDEIKPRYLELCEAGAVD